MPKQPPFSITNEILNLSAEIAEMVGKISVTQKLDKNPTLRRENRIKTIYGSLAIEQNTLTLEQVTATLNGKRVVAPPKDIEEVKNAFEIYELLDTLDPYSVNDLLKAHSVMMRGLVTNAGEFRERPVGVVDSSTGRVIHFGTLPAYVPDAINDLLEWTRSSNVHMLIKACVFHYEFELIHPFIDGNGRVGRLWHTLLLSKWQPIFAWIPIESMIFKNQKEYYQAINYCNNVCDSTKFIEFMLETIRLALVELTCPEQLAQEQDEEQVIEMILSFCSEPRTRAQIQEHIGVSSRKLFTTKFLTPLIESGQLKMTIPDKPTSRNQKYVKD